MLVALCTPLLANKLYVYSELTRIDPFGKVVPQDKGSADPRTILSPGFPRNGTSSLRLVVELDKPGVFQIDIAQNPENAVKPMLYKEVFEKVGEGWVPDRLLPVPIPYEGSETDFGIPGQSVVTFWLDLTVPRDAPVDRVKIEPQMWVPAIQDWVIYPMEVRILEPRVPAPKETWAALPPVSEPADAALLGPLRGALCGIKEPEGKAELTARAYVRRNATYQLAIAGTADFMRTALTKAPGIGINPQGLCAATPERSPLGPEWFLRFRDTVNRLKSSIMP
ncbi:MAG TPA: hypothetical protein VEQ63_16010 [Bryobacteraceae bacterium]|nr:hypothetical protein [Bryobacteraceae bacterium]